MHHLNRESSTDRIYREEFLSRLSPVDCKQNGSLWSFACPYCAHQQSKEWKRNKKTACLLWSSTQNSWKFACQRCCKKTNFFHALRDFDPDLGARYQRERDKAGTTGWGHDCPSLPLQGHLPSRSPAMPERPQAGQKDLQGHPSSSAPIRLPRLTPQQQAGHQSKINHALKQRKQRRQKASDT
jgi:hypothetical protein